MLTGDSDPEVSGVLPTCPPIRDSESLDCLVMPSSFVQFLGCSYRRIHQAWGRWASPKEVHRRWDVPTKRWCSEAP